MSGPATLNSCSPGASWVDSISMSEKNRWPEIRGSPVVVPVLETKLTFAGPLTDKPVREEYCGSMNKVTGIFPLGFNRKVVVEEESPAMTSYGRTTSSSLSTYGPCGMLILEICEPGATGA